MSLDKSIIAALLTALVFTALAHGAVEPWSVAIFEGIIVAIMILWGIKALRERRVEITVPHCAWPIAGLLLIGIAQSAGLSLDLESTRHAVLMLFILTVAFVAAANFFVTSERLMLLANVLTGFGTLVALLALVQSFTSDGRIFFLHPTVHSVFGPFVNHNHFAGYMDMLAPLPLGLMLTVVRGGARLVYGFAAILMGVASIYSGSRSGAISLLGALIFMAFMSRRTRHRGGLPRTTRIAVLAAISVAIIAGVVWVGAERIVERFGQTVDSTLHAEGPDVGRAQIWRETMRMIGDRPVFGAGLGSYYTAYPAYAENESLLGLDYSHNDFLQIVADAGFVGGILAFWFVAAVLYALYRGIRARDPLSAGLSLAGGAGIIAVLIQSLTDTDLQIPSNALLFLVLTAVVCCVPMPRAVLIGGEAA